MSFWLSGTWMRRSARLSSARLSPSRTDGGSGSAMSSTMSSTCRTDRAITWEPSLPVAG